MTGPYAYVANPMQLTSAVVMGVQALHYRSPGLALVTGAFLLFDAIYAAHYNKVHIARAMPREWSSYKAFVADWRPRWTPYRPGRPLVLARSAREGTRRLGWGLATDPGLRIRRRRAEGYARLVFSCAETGVRDRGVAALARILERRNLAWAIVGWTLRLPLLTDLIEALTRLRIVLREVSRMEGLAPRRGSRSAAAPGVAGSGSAVRL
jgi:hypothetical protein